MYPHVVQFETRQHEFARDLQLIRERRQDEQTRSRTLSAGASKDGAFARFRALYARPSSR